MGADCRVLCLWYNLHRYAGILSKIALVAHSPLGPAAGPRRPNLIYLRADPGADQHTHGHGYPSPLGHADLHADLRVDGYPHELPDQYADANFDDDAHTVPDTDAEQHARRITDELACALDHAQRR